MFYRLSVHVTDQFIQYKVISGEDYEVYRYGVQNGIILLFNLLSALTIGFLCKMPIECSLFLFSFIPLRSFAGGYHAKTAVRCYLYSMMIITGILLGIRYLNIPAWIYMALSGFGILTTLILAPIEDRNKPLDSIEKSVYRKRSLLILVVELCGLIFSALLHFEQAFHAMSMALLCIGALEIAGYLKNRYYLDA